MVPPLHHEGASFTLLGEAPGAEEEVVGEPFVGASGKHLLKMMRNVGWRRKDANWNNVILCRPPDNKFKELEDAVRRENKRRLETGEELILQPREACRPRLAHELRDAKNIVTVGGPALQTFAHRASVLTARGGPLTVDWVGKTRKVFPTLHPAFVMRAMRWNHVLLSDLQRAVRWFSGQDTWRDPHVVYHPDPAFLEAFLTHPDADAYTYDLETDGIEALTANVRCVGIGNERIVVVVGIESKDKTLRYYTRTDEERIKDILRQFFVGPKLKIGHNIGYYDRLVIERWLGVVPAPIRDTIILHRLVESELPHNLGYIGSLYTDVHAWKTDREGRKKALEAESDDELHKYCAVDVAVTDRVRGPLDRHVIARGQSGLVADDHAMQSICAEMHTVGMYIDQKKRSEYEKEYTERLVHHRTELQKIVGDLNPGSPQQLRRILFDKWELDPQVDRKLKYTKSGDISTCDDVLLACLATRGLEKLRREAIEHIRYYRKAAKVLGTYVRKLRYTNDNSWAEISYEEDENEEDPDLAQDPTDDTPGGIVNPRTGRMHPGYNAAVAVTGRLSSSKPMNAQNIPGTLKPMIRAAPGHILVAADADQLELRIAAARWKSTQYLQAFADGLDPHSSVTSLTCFGDRFVKAAIACGTGPGPWRSGTKFKGDAKSMRDLAKRVQYASQYKAFVDTVCRVIRQTEVNNDADPLGRTTLLPYVNLDLAQVRLMHANWLKGSRFDLGWAFELALYSQHGYIAEPVSGRRRDFLDGENENEIVNFAIQAAGASLMNRALIRIVEQIPARAWGLGTGVINQCHDAITIECPQDGAYFDEAKKKWVAPKGSIPWRVQQIVEEAMNQTDPGLSGVTFTAVADLGMTWAEV